MGYYSNFEIENTTISNMQEQLESLTDYRWYSESYLGDSKWYSWERDLRKLAILNPNDNFIVVRYGEENGDIERILATGGEIIIQKAVPSWETIDKSSI
jgi:hypothetical protein